MDVRLTLDENTNPNRPNGSSSCAQNHPSLIGSGSSFIACYLLSRLQGYYINHKSCTSKQKVFLCLSSCISSLSVPCVPSFFFFAFGFEPTRVRANANTRHPSGLPLSFLFSLLSFMVLRAAPVKGIGERREGTPARVLLLPPFFVWSLFGISKQGNKSSTT